MSARAIINTPREDREGDVIVPRGVQLENYRKNPVVLWEHGLGEITRPIAKCQNPNGELALEVTDNEISAISFFTDKCLESLQIFHLIAEGMVRATSVRALPIKSSIRKTSTAGTGIILEEWELIEWSWGALGVNPDAIARTLDRGTIEGRKITEPLLKSLKAVLPADQNTFPGWSRTNPTMNAAQVSTSSVSEKSSDQPDSHNVAPCQIKTTPREKQLIPDKPDPAGLSVSYAARNKKKKLLPLGAQLLSYLSGSISELIERLYSSEEILENEQIHKYLKSFLQVLQDQQHHLHDLYAEIYRHLPSLNESLQTAETSNLFQCPDQTEIFSWLKQQESQQPLTAGQSQAQEPVSKTQATSSDHRQVILELLKEFKHQNDGSAQVSTQKLERHVEELSQSLKVLQRKICDLLPVQ
ncbi:hypothetical protein Enr10x_58390 [Gimesia panareensis]|uniref:Caudovirus prohead protease n=1 Tax=Gimesia panareensis TaxID=2527978 RepID=A0A517QFR6_9PLAN|nr:hypothetical protein [Gimesia panareensis]QDT30473.1 hypothetical protein Enr10x_58390 [Gimesia panareensis]